MREVFIKGQHQDVSLIHGKRIHDPADVVLNLGLLDQEIGCRLLVRNERRIIRIEFRPACFPEAIDAEFLAIVKIQVDGEAFAGSNCAALRQTDTIASWVISSAPDASAPSLRQ